MRYAELNLFGVYVAPIAPMIVLTWLLVLPVRRVAERFGLPRSVSHPALFWFAVYTIARSGIIHQASANADNAQREAERRSKLSSLEASEEEKQTYRTTALAATAASRQAVANLAQARVNLQRATIRSPVNGYVTNLLAQVGDYATA